MRRELVIGERVQGDIVKVIDDVQKPFAFARIQDVARDLFIPQSAVANAHYLTEGDRIECDVRMDTQGRLFGDAVDVLTRDAWGPAA